MADADAMLPLQRAVIEKLKATAAVTANVPAVRIVTRANPTLTKPYISLGPVHVIPEIADEYEGSDQRIQVDAWSANSEPKEVGLIGRAIRSALHNASLSLVDDQRLVSIEIEDTQYLTEPDGITQHAALIFVAHTEPAA